MNPKKKTTKKVPRTSKNEKIMKNKLNDEKKSSKENNQRKESINIITEKNRILEMHEIEKNILSVNELIKKDIFIDIKIKNVVKNKLMNKISLISIDNALSNPDTVSSIGKDLKIQEKRIIKPLTITSINSNSIINIRSAIREISLNLNSE